MRKAGLRRNKSKKPALPFGAPLTGRNLLNAADRGSFG